MAVPAVVLYAVAVEQSKIEWKSRLCYSHGVYSAPHGNGFAALFGYSGTPGAVRLAVEHLFKWQIKRRMSDSLPSWGRLLIRRIFGMQQTASTLLYTTLFE